MLLFKNKTKKLKAQFSTSEIFLGTSLGFCVAQDCTKLISLRRLQRRQHPVQVVPLALALELRGALRSTPLGAVLSTQSHKAPGSGDPLRLWPPETGVCENATTTFASNYGELSNCMRLRKRELSLCATEKLCGFPL